MDKIICWCGEEAIHIRFCHEHAPRCRSGAHFDGNCRCKGWYGENASIDEVRDITWHQAEIATLRARVTELEEALVDWQTSDAVAQMRLADAQAEIARLTPAPPKAPTPLCEQCVHLSCAMDGTCFGCGGTIIRVDP